MRINVILGLIVLSIGMLAGGCQRTATNNVTVNSNANANAGHEMSNMNGMSNMDHEMSSMRMHDMTNMNSDPGAADHPYDLQFLDSMIHHHNGAIMMARMVLGKTERPELKEFAQKIVGDQSKEIAYMRQLREKWYAGNPAAVNMEIPGMIGGMKMMNGEHMKEMDEMDPKHFDNHFLKMMIAHHEGAVVMSSDALKKAEHSELKQLAERIINAQQPEIEQMKKWQTAWNK